MAVPVTTMSKIRYIPFVLVLAGMFFCRQAFCASPESMLERAQNLIETGRADSARVILDELLKSPLETEERVQALYYFSRVMNQIGSLGEEIKYLVMAREQSRGTSVEDLITRDYARLLIQTANYDECIAMTEEFRSRQEKSPIAEEIFTITADAFYRKNDFQRAFNIYQEISRTYPETPSGMDAMLSQGRCLYNLGLIGGAIEQLQQFLTDYPDNPGCPEALWLLGNCYDVLKDSPHAATAYQRLSINYPQYPRIMEVYFRLGQDFLASDQLIESENSFQNFIANTDSTDSLYDQALLNLERINFRNGSYPDQITMYEQFVTRHPASSLDPEILFDLAKYYVTAGKSEQAIEKYRVLMSNQQYLAYADSAALLTADLYVANGERDRAITFLTLLAAQAGIPERTQKYLLRVGSYYESWDEPESAIAWYDSAYFRKGDPDLSVLALLGIGRILKNLDRLLEAENVYKRIIAEFPGNSYRKEVFMSISDVYYQAGYVDKAASSAESAVSLADGEEKAKILLYIAGLYEELDEAHALQLYGIVFNNPLNTKPMKTEALFRYGDLAMRIGDREKATKAFAAVVENNVDSLSVSRAKEKLNSLMAGQ